MPYDYRGAIEEARKAGAILPSSFFESKAARDALYQLNKENDEKNKAQKAKNMTASDMAAEEAKRRKLPGYKKGGKVKKTGLALVHKGERVITAGQQTKLAKKVNAKPHDVRNGIRGEAKEEYKNRIAGTMAKLFSRS